jgi:lysophospholipase L1-like esterase
VLGDSFTYGLGVGDDQTYCARLAAELPGLEVINAGVNGYGTAQQLILLREDGLRFAPDIVVVGFFVNDLDDNVVGATRERFVVEDGALRERPAVEAVVTRAPANRSDRRSWLRSSYAYRFLSDRGKQLRAAHASADGPADVLTGERRESAWQLALALLREIHRTAREGGAELVLLAIPQRVQVQPDDRPPGDDGAGHDVLARLRPFAEAEGIPLVDPLPALRAAYATSGQPLYYREDRHMRPEGHAIVARALAEALRERVGSGGP